jgi:hypothetical protein
MSKPKPHTCCPHIAGAPFIVSAGPDGRPQVAGQPQTCCWCGPLHVGYIGIVENGHGPFVRYQMPSKIVAARDVPVILGKNGN